MDEDAEGEAPQSKKNRVMLRVKHLKSKKKRVMLRAKHLSLKKVG